MEETLVRLASWMPFEQARDLLQDLLGIQVSKATARRATLQAGEAALLACEREVERLQQEVPEAPEGADKQLLSADGAMVHLVGGEWAEVKTLVMGVVGRNKRGEVCTQQLSPFSRLLEAERFTHASLFETHRRGLERAAAVCAVQDGAEWLQGLVDYQRADAVRILDFAHAAEGRLPRTWLEGVLHRLKHQGPARVLTHLRWLAARYPSPLIQEKLAYLQKREGHMQYPTSQAAGWPIGSGSVESANKVVVEARLKGAGMRWGRHNVNPMLVLRKAVCNRCWSETWTSTRTQRQTQRRRQRQAESHQRLRRTFWTLLLWVARHSGRSRPPVPAASAAAAEVVTKPPVRRLGSGYSWRQPFLRRPPSTPALSGAVGAKK